MPLSEITVWPRTHETGFNISGNGIWYYKQRMKLSVNVKIVGRVLEILIKKSMSDISKMYIGGRTLS